jgi:RTX calcium-binding nonapeptide repeat (4 copies)
VRASRWLIAILTVATAALALAAPALAATGVSYEESRSLSSGVTGYFFFTGQDSDASSAVIRLDPNNQILVTDGAGLQPSGMCAYQSPLSRTAVVCRGTPGLPLSTANIVLGAGNDRLVVQAAGGILPRTSISAGSGNDFVVGGPGSDSIYGDGGADSLRGGGGPDLLFGEGGNDRLYGDPGDDRLTGNFGSDVLFAGTGNDFLDGGPGNDRLFTGPGRDRWTVGGGINFVDGRRAT